MTPVTTLTNDRAAIGGRAPARDVALETPFSFKVNNMTKQEGVASEMTLSPKECVAYISSQFPLCEGDLIFTGTPKGVGPVVAGDKGMLTFGSIQYGVIWHES